MSTLEHRPERALGPAPTVAAGAGFLAAALALACAAALLAGWAPIAFSIATVFLFAGPHNWLEARYFLARMPSRWGKLTGYFTFSFAGILLLCGAFWVLAWGGFDRETHFFGLSLWCTALLLWIATMVHMRSTINPPRDWGWVWPVAFLLIAVSWVAPQYIFLTMVYAHPLMALWLLARELRRSRPEWLPALYLFAATIPLFVGLLWLRLGSAPPLVATRPLEEEIIRHSGAGFDVLAALSSHFLVATHTFLEMIHYGVWVVAIPLINFQFAPFKIDKMPLATRGRGWRRGVQLTLLAGVGIMLILWACFLVDYPTTRSIYFTIALLHVLAEVPFLLRAL
jgi:hypothetical protein